MLNKMSETTEKAAETSTEIKVNEKDVDSTTSVLTREGMLNMLRDKICLDIKNAVSRFNEVQKEQECMLKTLMEWSQKFQVFEELFSSKMTLYDENMAKIEDFRKGYDDTINSLDKTYVTQEALKLLLKTEFEKYEQLSEAKMSTKFSSEATEKIKQSETALSESFDKKLNAKVEDWSSKTKEQNLEIADIKKANLDKYKSVNNLLEQLKKNLPGLEKKVTELGGSLLGFKTESKKEHQQFASLQKEIEELKKEVATQSQEIKQQESNQKEMMMQLNKSQHLDDETAPQPQTEELIEATNECNPNYKDCGTESANNNDNCYACGSPETEEIQLSVKAALITSVNDSSEAKKDTQLQTEQQKSTHSSMLPAEKQASLNSSTETNVVSGSAAVALETEPQGLNTGAKNAAHSGRNRFKQTENLDLASKNGAAGINPVLCRRKQALKDAHKPCQPEEITIMNVQFDQTAINNQVVALQTQTKLMDLNEDLKYTGDTAVASDFDDFELQENNTAVDRGKIEEKVKKEETGKIEEKVKKEERGTTEERCGGRNISSTLTTGAVLLLTLSLIGHQLYTYYRRL